MGDHRSRWSDVQRVSTFIAPRSEHGFRLISVPQQCPRSPTTSGPRLISISVDSRITN